MGQIVKKKDSVKIFGYTRAFVHFTDQNIIWPKITKPKSHRGVGGSKIFGCLRMGGGGGRIFGTFLRTSYMYDP